MNTRNLWNVSTLKMFAMGRYLTTRGGLLKGSNDCTLLHVTYLGDKSMARVEIELEFEKDEVSDADVYNYLNELMDNNCLDWNVVKNRNPLEG